MKDYFIKNKKHILVTLAVAAPIVLFYLTLGCPLRYFTGICCPGCGMTRALWYVLTLDFATAFHMHPLIFIMPIVAIIFLLRDKLPPRLRALLVILFCVLMGGVYLWRLFNGSDIVYIDTSRGFLNKLFEYISGGI